MSMSIYDINAAIVALVDQETGEISDEQAFDDLQMARDEKIENIGCYYKDSLAEAKAIKEEEENLAARRKVVENRAERLKNLLAYALKGDKWNSPRLKVSYRKSVTVDVAPEFVEWAEEHDKDLLTYSDPKPKKTAIKAAVQRGDIPDGLATLTEHENMNVK